MNQITAFRDEHYFLSNFYQCEILMDGVFYPTTENAYQAAKTLSKWERTAFERCSPGQSKKLGRTITLRPDWEDVKIAVMRTVLFQKFSQKELCDLLIETGDAILIEGNKWNDRFWGMVYTDALGWTGANYLGQLLMEVRDHYKTMKATEK